VNTHIEQIQKDVLKSLEKARNAEEIQALSVKYLGRKGLITGVLKGISQLPKEERPSAGKKANQIRVAVDKAIQDALQNIADANETSDDAIDVSLPGRSPLTGSLHPISQIQQEICDIFGRPGTCRTRSLFRKTLCCEHTHRPCRFVSWKKPPRRFV
jgi:phenylalanyl-tRNA synthetase alpha chain